MKRFTALLALLFAAAHFTNAQADRQGTHPPTAAELIALHDAGFRTEELTTLLERNGVPTLAREDLRKLTESGIPDAIMQRLRAAAEKSSPSRLSIEDIVGLTTSGVGDDAIVKLIANSESTYQLTTEQWLDLMRKGVTPAVIRALRNKVAAEPRNQADSRSSKVSLEDIRKFAADGVAGDEMVRRIRAADGTFEITVDQLVVMGRQGVPREVLKEIWARRSKTMTADAQPAAMAHEPDAASQPVRTSDTTHRDLLLHVEDGGGFSLLAPVAFKVRRESRGSNALLSFVLGETESASNLAPAELSIFRYRSNTPDRLTEANLQAIADNFFARLQASYAQRKLTVSFAKAVPARIAGQPALRARVTTGAADGTTHQGDIVVTFAGDQIFVISTAIRTDQMNDFTVPLETCIRSFALQSRKPRPDAGGNDNERLATLVTAWREAVQNRDFALYDALFAAGGNQQQRREGFVALCDRLADPGIRLVTGPINIEKDGAVVSLKLLGTEPLQTIDLRWTKDGATFALTEK